MKNNNQGTLSELNDILFAELDRLNDSEVTGDELTEEIKRAGAMGNIAATIIANANVLLKAKIAEGDGRLDVSNGLPHLLNG